MGCLKVVAAAILASLYTTLLTRKCGHHEIPSSQSMTPLQYLWMTLARSAQSQVLYVINRNISV